MQNRSGLFTNSGARLLAAFAVVVAMAGVMLLGGATPALAVGEPTVTSVTPATGPNSGTVALVGTLFTGTTGVTVGGVSATFSAVTATTMNVAIPIATPGGQVDILVTNLSGTSAVSAGDKYTNTSLPTVTGLSITSGPTTGLTALTITGTGFTPTATVTFGGTPATASYNSGTSITVTSPAHAAGQVDVIVSTTNGFSPNTAADNFTYGGAPTVSLVNPSSGGTGIAVAISGTGFTGATGVTVGGVTASFTSGTDTSMSVTIPASTPGGLVDILVTNLSGTSAVSALDKYNNTSLPTVTSLSISSGPVTGLTALIVTGSGFTPTGMTVTFGGTLASFTYNSGTSITATSPAHAAGQVDVIVTTVNGPSTNTAADNFTYGASTLPTISSISPSSGPVSGGNLVTILGTNLNGASQVAFGTQIAFPQTTSATSVTVLVPFSSTAGVQTVEVVITTPAGPSGNPGTANDYTYTGGPTVTLVSPNTGPTTGLTSVAITGTGFTPTNMTVSFGGTSTLNFTYNSATSITAFSPAHSAGLVNVVVTTSSGTSPDTTADDFTYTGTTAPTITGLSPTSGAVGITVTITGTGFTGATQVTVGGVTAAFTVASDSSINVTIPAGTPGGVVNIRVTTPNGTSADVAADNFTNTSSSGATTTYTLYFRWSLISWNGIDNITALNAVKGIETGTANPATNDVSASVTAIWYFDGPSQQFKGYFVGFDNTPGANDFTTLRRGTSYWIAISTSGSVTWTVLQGS